MMSVFGKKDSGEEPRYKVYNLKPTPEEVEKQQRVDDLYKILFWVFFLYTLVDTVFSLF